MSIAEENPGAGSVGQVRRRRRRRWSEAQKRQIVAETPPTTIDEVHQALGGHTGHRYSARPAPVLECQEVPATYCRLRPDDSHGVP